MAQNSQIGKSIGELSYRAATSRNLRGLSVCWVLCVAGAHGRSTDGACEGAATTGAAKCSHGAARDRRQQAGVARKQSTKFLVGSTLGFQEAAPTQTRARMGDQKT